MGAEGAELRRLARGADDERCEAVERGRVHRPCGLMKPGARFGEGGVANPCGEPVDIFATLFQHLGHVVAREGERTSGEATDRLQRDGAEVKKEIR